MIAKASVFVLEAKCYQGRIRAEGDAKRSAWFMQKISGQKIPIRCGSKLNPYTQLCGYVDSVRDKLDVTTTGGRIRVYGLVVFDAGADIAEVSAQIGGTYRVTTLDCLFQTIEDMDTDRNRSFVDKSTLTPKQIEDVLCGRPVSKVA